MEGASRKVLLRKSSEEAHPDKPHEAKKAEQSKAKEPVKASAKASKEDDAFLNNFLDAYDAQKKTAPVSASVEPATRTLQQRVQKAFPETQQVQPNSNGNVDDVISDFLSNYDSKP